MFLLSSSHPLIFVCEKVFIRDDGEREGRREQNALLPSLKTDKMRRKRRSSATVRHAKTEVGQVEISTFFWRNC